MDIKAIYKAKQYMGINDWVRGFAKLNRYTDSVLTLQHSR